ncbi:hypothetical protein BP5796_05755 [Coleophoma crateriformis]|uniref:Uncharacterized protein n=1 Tax=Coleophoma crateriformis TaxID=565419 RepID=A0A3D8RV23_9HELO|nr:hypothetical protein BP5796_05755 [Coleophoma crateriformis]
MNLKHHIFTLILRGRSFVAPVGRNPKRILDVGTGAGIWAMELFDLIHWRMLFTAIKHWPRLYEQAYQNLKPGGWIEVDEHESDINSDDDSVLKAQDLKDWFKLVAEACAKLGRDSNIAHKQK